MIESLLHFMGEYMLEGMTLFMALSFFFRYVIFTSSKKDEAYFSQFTRELMSTIDEDKIKNTVFTDIEGYLINLLGRVNGKLPHRNLRNLNKDDRLSQTTLKEFVGSKHGMISSIQAESSVFSCPVPPNFHQLTHRIMNQDKKWTQIFGFINIDMLIRVLGLLPGLFIIFGVFGTFIGISLALPEIAKIDFSNIEASGETLTQFVINVTFAMKTSVAGIAYSIVLTLLNTMFPVEGTRENTIEKVETSLEVLWYHVQKDGQKEKPSKSDLILEKMAKTLENIENFLLNSNKSNVG